MTDQPPPSGSPPPADAPAAGADAKLPPSHLTPRTREGWIATLVYLGLFLLVMPPVTHTVLDRPDVWVLGVPFFFAALLALYTGLIVVLVWALRRRL
jgi:apolipoprotein N-acyltransferase